VTQARILKEIPYTKRPTKCINQKTLQSITKHTSYLTPVHTCFGINELEYWKKFHIRKDQRNALIRKHYNQSQNTLLIWRQLVHVSAPTCHHQGVFLQHIFVGPTNISGTTHSHFQTSKLQAAKRQNATVHVHIAASTISHRDWPHFLHYHRRNIPGLCAQIYVAIYDPKRSRSDKARGTLYTLTRGTSQVLIGWVHFGSNIVIDKERKTNKM